MSGNLTPLTINIIRNNYWDNKRQKGKPIKYYTFQSFGGKDIDGKPLSSKNRKAYIMVPTGNLIHGCKTIHGWLADKQMQPIGPYKSTGPKANFYYLEGILTHSNGKKIQPELIYLQVCSGPLNGLSEDCLDEVNCWIKS